MKNFIDFKKNVGNSADGVLFLSLNSDATTQVCFDLFDTKKQEFLSGDDLGDIMRAMGFRHWQFETFNIEKSSEKCKY